MRIDDFTGLYWNGKHTSDLGLTVVTASSRYNLNPISSIKNNTVEVPGGDGDYFYNSTYGSKKITVNIAFDNLDDNQWREIQNWLYHKEISDLIFDECPYKAWGAKLDGTPQITYLCFDEPDESKERLANGGYPTHRIYKGEGTLNFYIPFPYAYSARDITGKYMKYIDVLRHYTSSEKGEIQTVDIGLSGALTLSKLGMIKLNKIYGNSGLLNSEIGEYKRAQLYSVTNSKSYPLKIMTKGNKWIELELAFTPEEDVYFDSVGGVHDTIEFSEDSGYFLRKRVSAINIDNANTIKPISEEDGVYVYNMKDLFGLNSTKDNIYLSDYMNLSAIDISIDKNQQGGKADVTNFDLGCDKFIFLNNKPKDNELGVFWVEDVRYDKKNQKIIDFKLAFKPTLAAPLSGPLNFLYPSKEIDYILYSSQFKYEQATMYNEAEESISFQIINQTEISNRLIFTTEFIVVPAIYQNIDDWKDSSGLKLSQIDETDGLKYDVCQKISKAPQATYGFKVYNGGDLPTPFKITIPLCGKIKGMDLSDKGEVIFALVNGLSEENTYQDYKQIKSLVDLNKNNVYYVKNDGKINTDTEYYFYQIENYETGLCSFLTENGDKEKYIYNQMYRFCVNNDYLENLGMFSIRFQDEDALESYIQLAQNYIKAFGQNRSAMNLSLEIDTYKQTINLIIHSAYTNKEEIIPMYFTLYRGEFFNIPPNFDNLYLLVYNNRNDGVLETTPKKVPDIEYRYLYL